MYGCPGSTINACWNRSATSRRQKLKKGIINNLQHLLRNLFYFNQTASAIPGVIQFDLSDDMATKLDIEFYQDARDALLKALVD